MEGERREDVLQHRLSSGLNYSIPGNKGCMNGKINHQISKHVKNKGINEMCKSNERKGKEENQSEKGILPRKPLALNARIDGREPGPGTLYKVSLLYYSVLLVSTAK
jgi:hypothetical protein